MAKKPLPAKVRRKLLQRKLAKLARKGKADDATKHRIRKQ